jgi:hypothetical protein
MKISERLNSLLPPEFVARPRVHLGSAFEIDVATFEKVGASSAPHATRGNGGASWSPAKSTLLLDEEVPIPSEYEVLVYSQDFDRRLVAAVEIVSPSNKDRPENRRAFVHKCAALLHQGVCVAIVDVVTSRSANLYRELADEMKTKPVKLRGSIYAVSCRGWRTDDHFRLEAWDHELTIGKPLPTLPLWLTDELFVPLELEASYEDACRALRID